MSKELVKYTVFHRRLKVNKEETIDEREVPVTNVEELFAKLYQAVDSDEANLTQLLKENFVYSEVKGSSFSPLIWHDNHKTCDIYKYHHHYTAKVLEALVIDYNAEFRKLLQAARPSAKKILLDFTGMALQGANFEGIDLKFANFTDADLTGSNITEQQLNECQTYLNATLPETVNVIPYWSDAKVKGVKKDLTELEKHGEDLIKLPDLASKRKGQLAINHAYFLGQMIEKYPLNGKFQTTFLKKLHEDDAKFDEPRTEYKTIAANIGLAVLGTIFYLAAIAIHKAVTGRWLFFSQTTTSKIVEKIENRVVAAVK